MKKNAWLWIAGTTLLAACGGEERERVGMADQALTEVTLEDVGLNNTFSSLEGVNSLGQMVGGYESTSDIHAFRLEDNVFTDIHPAGSTYSEALTIGPSGIAGGMVDYRAAVWPDNSAVMIDTLSSSFSYVTQINASSEAIGLWRSSMGYIRAFYWSAASGMIDIGDIGGGIAFTQAYAINDLGQVVGFSFAYPNGPHHAVSWQNGVLTDLGTLGGGRSDAFDVNDNGVAVGGAQTESGVWHACNWVDGVIHDLDPTALEDSFAFSVNNSGHIVGSRRIGGQPHATLWRDGGVLDLGAGAGGRAALINDLDIISGIRDGAPGFLWANPIDGPIDLSAPPGAPVHTAAVALGPNMAVGLAFSNGANIYPDARAALWRLHIAPPPPNDAIGAIGDAVADLPLGPGEANALDSKLDAALHQCARGNENAARNQIQAFIHQMQALMHAGKIPPEEGQSVIALASAILDDLSCP